MSNVYHGNISSLLVDKEVCITEELNLHIVAIATSYFTRHFQGYSLVVAADKVEACHRPLQESYIAVHVYPALQLGQAMVLPTKC